MPFLIKKIYIILYINIKSWYQKVIVSNMEMQHIAHMIRKLKYMMDQQW